MKFVQYMYAAIRFSSRWCRLPRFDYCYSLAIDKVATELPAFISS